MPWSPMRYIERILENLEVLGYEKKAPTLAVNKEIIRVTGVSYDRKVKHIFEVMVRLGYLKDNGNGTWTIKRITEAEKHGLHQLR